MPNEIHFIIHVGFRKHHATEAIDTGAIVGRECLPELLGRRRWHGMRPIRALNQAWRGTDQHETRGRSGKRGPEGQRDGTPHRPAGNDRSLQIEMIDDVFQVCDEILPE